MKLPRNLDEAVETGRANLEGLVDEGRRSVSRLYADGRGWIEEHAPDRGEVRRSAGRLRRDAVRRGGAATRAAVRRAEADDRLRAPVRWIEARLPQQSRTSTVLWPSVLAAAGAGVAFWWWTSWSRGRAEAAERAALDAAGGAAGAAHPEAVMAHAPEPAGGPVDAPDVSASKLSEPAEDLMAHSPPPEAAGGAGAPSGLAEGVAGVTSAAAARSLEESLAVQGSAKASRKSANGAAA